MNGQKDVRVIVGVHDSPAGLGALRQAVTEARQRGAQLYAIRAFAVTPEWRRAGLDDWWRHATGQAEEYARQAFAAAMGRLPADLAVKVVGVQGSPGAALVDYAYRDSDLLVVGASRRGRLRRLLRTTVARHCLDHAPCPVLVVPAQEMANSSSPRALRRSLHREVNRLTATGVPGVAGTRIRRR